MSSRNLALVTTGLGLVLAAGVTACAPRATDGPGDRAADVSHEVTVWYGGPVQTDDVTMAIPPGWVAVQQHHDTDGPRTTGREIAQNLDWCDGPVCHALIGAWLDGLGETPLALLGPPLDDAEPLQDGGTQCGVEGPESALGRTASEVAAIGFEAFDRSEHLEVADRPETRRLGELVVASYDFAVKADDIVGAVHIYGDGERFFRLSCQGHQRPSDSWRSIADTLEPAQPTAAWASAENSTAVYPPDLQSMLPLWVDGRGLASHAHRGLDYLRGWSRMPSEMVAQLERDPESIARILGTDFELDDIELAVAGRSSTSDPASLITALRVAGIPAHTLPLSMAVPEADALSWTEQTFGGRTVQVGSPPTADRARAEPERAYVYDVGDVRFTITAADEAWAAEAIARLRPDPVVEDTALLVQLPDGWHAGHSPTVLQDVVAEAYADGIRLSAHDATRVGQPYVPTLQAYDGQTRLDEDVAATLDRWASTYSAEHAHGRTIKGVERVSLPAGEALRLDLEGSPPGAGFDVAEVRYLVATAAGVFDLLFSVEAAALAEYEPTFREIAASFLDGQADPDGPLARLARGELTRTELELGAAGYPTPVAPEPGAVSDNTGPVAIGGRLEVPAVGLALDIPEGWYAIDVTHPEVVPAMEGFDPTTRDLLAGRLRPENPLMRGNFPVTIEADHLTGLALEELLAADTDGRFALVTLPPADGVGAHHECAVYHWQTEEPNAAAEAASTLPFLEESDPPATVTMLELPAGEAAMIAASNGDWQFAIFIIVRDGRAYHLECGDDERHDRSWQTIAEGLRFTTADR